MIDPIEAAAPAAYEEERRLSQHGVPWRRLGRGARDKWRAIARAAVAEARAAERERCAKVADAWVGAIRQNPADCIADEIRALSDETPSAGERGPIAEEIVAALKRLPSDDVRLDVFSHFCRHCGSVDLPCYCMADD